MYVYRISSQYQLKKEYVSVIPKLIGYAKQKNIWITSLPEIYNWFYNLEGIDIKTKIRSGRRILLEVVNNYEIPRSEFIVTLYFNRNVDNIEVSSEIISIDSPRYEFKKDSNLLILFFETLDPGETRSYFIDYDSMNA